MKVCACVLLFTIIANVGKSTAEGLPLNERAVHLALETVLEFNDKDKASDLKFLDKVKNLINKVKTVIDKTGSYRRDFKDGDIETLTEFIQQAVALLNAYDDATFGDFFKTLDDEIRKYHYRGCKFHELMENYEIRSLLRYAFDLISGKPVQVIKAYMNVLADTLKDESYDDNVKEIVDYINSLYGAKAKDKLTKVLQEIEDYGKATPKKKHAASRILKEGIRSIIFDHYTALNPNARRELKSKIELYLKKSKTSSPKLIHNNNRPETVSKKPHTTIKKEPLKSPEKKLERIDINQKDIKKIAKNDKKLMRHRKEKKDHSKFPDIPLHTGKPVKEGKENKKDKPRAQSEDKDLTSISSSSEDDDESSSDVGINSIEKSQERQKAYNTMRYVTLYPETITQIPRNSSKDVNFINRSVRATTPFRQRVLTMWVEETTGGIPQHILNKYKATTLKPHKRHKKHEKRHKKKHSKGKKTHHKKHKSHYTTKQLMKYTRRSTYKPYRYTTKHRSKLSYDRIKYANGKPQQQIPEHYEVPTLDKQNKPVNIFGPVRLDVNQNLLINKITARTTLPVTRHPMLRTTPSTHKPMALRNKIESKHMKRYPLPSNSTNTPGIALLMPVSIAAIGKRYKMLNGPQKLDMRKNADNPHSDEGLTIEHFDKRKRSGASQEDPFVIQRLHQLERELKEVKNSINTATKRSKKRDFDNSREKKEKHGEKDTDSYDIRSEESGKRNHHYKTTKLTAIRYNANNEQFTHASTVKKPEYQIEYKIVKEKGSDFKEIIPDQRVRANDEPTPFENKDRDIRHPSDERQAKSHNKTLLIDVSTRLYPITSTTDTITAKPTDEHTTTTPHFTGKALRDVTATNNPKTTKNYNDHTKTTTKTTTVAFSSSVATANTYKTTNVELDGARDGKTVSENQVIVKHDVKATTKIHNEESTVNHATSHGKDAIVLFKGLVEKSGKNVAENEV
ncbi:uncharacterized protein LOC118281265 [Spodoptera frugiperda]|uniref:Uncharacterized protein LOC118281265 n=1 Tax=Spodoptera frugiperda TaxID=7108 RepID=A0A9R0DK19_SPOFR|nr:uncharacterized protein LOC118281265 [Spodoptera frugiperda]